MIKFARAELAMMEETRLVLPDGNTRPPSYMDTQNTFCEFSKYVRFKRRGQERPIYPPKRRREERDMTDHLQEAREFVECAENFHDGRPAVSNLREILGDRYDAVTQEAAERDLGVRAPDTLADLLMRRVRDIEAERDALAAKVEAMQSTDGLSIMFGWLVHEVGEHTCGGYGPESNYMHEPGCGFEPILDLSKMEGWPGAEREPVDGAPA